VPRETTSIPDYDFSSQQAGPLSSAGPDVVNVRPSQVEELEILNDLMVALQRLPDTDSRLRAIKAAVAFFGIDLGESFRHGPIDIKWAPLTPSASAVSSFSEDRTISPKDFLLQKQPKTDVEKVACLAYFLTHYRDTPHFKTIDISKLNTDAAQPKFSNAAMAMDNATRSNYLVPASKGNRQLSASGELFVQALPDREAAKAAMSHARPRKRKKVAQSSAMDGARGN
jgi:hypothetical protein